MSAFQKPTSGQGNSTSPPLTQDVYSLQRQLADSPEPFFSIVSRVEKEQFEDGSLDNFIASDSINPHPTYSGLDTKGCECTLDPSGRKTHICNYCSDPSLYAIVARAFDQVNRRPKEKLQLLYEQTEAPVRNRPFLYQICTHHIRDMNVYEGMFMSPPPRMPPPSRYGSPAIFEVDPVPHEELQIDYDGNNIEMPNAQNQQRDRAILHPDDERIRRMWAEFNDNTALEGMVATTEEQGRLSVPPNRNYSHSTSAEASSPRTYDLQSEEESKQEWEDETEEETEEESEEESQLPLMPGYSKESSTLIEPQVPSEKYTTSESQISDCYRCDRPNSWENMVACDSDHGSRERWFHMTCAGLTIATAPSGDEIWLCEDCSKSNVPDENDNILYRDDDQVDSGKNSTGKHQKALEITESTSFKGIYDSDDSDESTGVNRTRKRKRQHELEFKQDLESSESDDGDDSAYADNSRKRRRQHEPKAKQISGPSKGPAHPQNTPATSGLTGPNFIAATTPAPAAQPSNRRQPKDRFPQSTADKVHELMKEVLEEGQFSEKKFISISDRLAERYGIELSHGAIKNYWNRKGRVTYQLDERKKPNPNKMVTGVQSPEDRKKARQQQSKAK